MKAWIAILVLLVMATQTCSPVCGQWVTDEGLVTPVTDEGESFAGTYCAKRFASGNTSATVSLFSDIDYEDYKWAFAYAPGGRTKTLSWQGCPLYSDDHTLFSATAVLSCLGSAQLTNEKRADQGDAQESADASVSGVPFSFTGDKTQTKSRQHAQLVNSAASGVGASKLATIKYQYTDPPGSGYQWVGEIVMEWFSKPDTTVHATANEASDTTSANCSDTYRNSAATGVWSSVSLTTSTISYATINADSTSDGDASGQASASAGFSTLNLSAQQG